ncbi:unnamed protein product [Microthlaspi erraticum]|uniref:Late embryogenesis abundant protein LEA-2 subgroup domain-containing protein n=1 Tax=Microthlaspi erraticum TaxID=1685480 RepID=A0A6D2L9R4_9BRAS|nr:unnamed protein product [Microthlaspi erraticum]CAA7061114.1 unnamed protein product [Microthlaspi erraticum]
MSGFPTPPSSATDPPPTSQWWNQLYLLIFRHNERTEEEKRSITKPMVLGYGAAFSFIAIFFLILNVANRLIPCNVSFSVESISASPSSATWHVDFLVTSPTSMCPVYYDVDGVYAKLGSLTTTVLNTTHEGLSRGHTKFSVDLATEGNQSHVAAAFPSVLDVKLSAKKKKLLLVDDYGHFDIRCQILNPGYEKTKCHSSFKKLKQCC